MTRPALDCCVPYGAPYPSGWAWQHSRKCPKYPSQKVGQERTPERIAIAMTRAGHPAGTSVRDSDAVTTWLNHPPGHGCRACQYVEHWLDRDDDLGEVELDA